MAKIVIFIANKETNLAQEANVKQIGDLHYELIDRSKVNMFEIYKFGNILIDFRIIAH